MLPAANDVLRNDVTLRVNDVALRANGFTANMKMPIGVFEQGSRSEPLTKRKMRMQVLLDTVKYNILYKIRYL